MARSLGAADQAGVVILENAFPITGAPTSYNVTLYASCDNSNCSLQGGDLTAYIASSKDFTTPGFFITATDHYNGTAISVFNATIGGVTINTTNGSVFVPTTQDSLTVSTRANNYFVNTTINHPTTSNLASVLRTYTKVLAVNTSGNSIQNFSINWSVAGGNASTVSTTNGLVFLPLNNNNYTVTIFDASDGRINYESTTATLTAAPFLQNYTFNLFFSNSFLIIFRNETTNLVVNDTVFFELISESFSTNGSTDNGTINLSLLIPAEYEIRYWYDPDVPRQFFTTLTNQSVQNLTLYIIEESISTFYLPIIRDLDGVPCGNNTISLLRYYIDINGYRVVEMTRTDTNGQGVLRVQPNIINYRFLFTGSCGTFTTDPQKIVDTSNGFTVGPEQTALDSLIALPSVSTALVFINSTNTFQMTWNDPTNTVIQACLLVQNNTLGVTDTFSEQCISGSTGSLISTVNNTNNTVFTATGRLETNTEFSSYEVGPVVASFVNDFLVWGLTGVFMTALVALAAVGFAATTASGMVFAVVGSIAVMSYWGIFLDTPWVLNGIIVLLFVWAAILAYKFRK